MMKLRDSLNDIHKTFELILNPRLIRVIKKLRNNQVN
jgi:hypothetical protein